MEPSRPRSESDTIHVVVAPEAPPAPAERRQTAAHYDGWVISSAEML